MSRPTCSYLGCCEPGVWRDDDDGRDYCGAHLIYVAYKSAVEKRPTEPAPQHEKVAS